MAATFASEQDEMKHNIDKFKIEDSEMVNYTSNSQHIGKEPNVKAAQIFPDSSSTCPPCLPVSKGSIKKMAQTRFVNSSPRSYRLMPASVESSDMTSFVEKSSHSHVFPRFFLDVAELWKISKRSELECNFTLAKSEKIVNSNDCIYEAKHKSPICHSSVEQHCLQNSQKRKFGEDRVDFREEISSATLGRHLQADFKRFFDSQELRESHPMGIAGFMKPKIRNAKLFYRHSAHIPMNRHALFSNLKKQRDAEMQSQYSLTPLVKRLSVSGLDETEERISCKNNINMFSPENNGVEVRELNPSPTKRSQFSAKRPSSNQKLGNDEPLQKKANCINTNDPV